ncbi:Histone deacetylase complex, SIN3 component [Phaffia rhodozyma]|uniref:Histone deacetylase complex, SIN3 component n=1 Tax=Phaffia rhodozyma TaxID=264483 RepID=A0A0F7SGC4_PHARH|nr:Histone deacetylase complex, SIN3 component [Phaffia rhodozyma]
MSTNPASSHSPSAQISTSVPPNPLSQQPAQLLPAPAPPPLPPTQIPSAQQTVAAGQSTSASSSPSEPSVIQPAISSATAAPAPPSLSAPGTGANSGLPTQPGAPGALTASTGASPAPTPGSASAMAGPNYRPLNVRDALSYLDQVKVQFSDQPDVYNRFLDVMKEFKGQMIDTPGVIDRVSSLFRGHPSLIQGFNTFLPPGYRIECLGGEGDERGLITVITPTGTVSQIAGQFSAGLAAVAAAGAAATPGSQQHTQQHPSAAGGGPAGVANSGYSQGIDRPFGSNPGLNQQQQQQQQASNPAQTASAASTPGGQQHQQSLPSLGQTHSLGPSQSGVSTPGAAQVLSGGIQGVQPPQAVRQPQVEFNHAINYVNKIKNRYAQDPDTYKQFLEVLQTYQKEQRPIQDVYAQVTILFKSAPDLLDEFKQFLPDTSNGAQSSGGLFGNLLGQMTGMQSDLAMSLPQTATAPQVQAPVPVPTGSADGGRPAKADRAGEKAKKADKAAKGEGAKSKDPQDGVPAKKKRGAGAAEKDPKTSAARTKKPKHHHKAEPSPPPEDYPVHPVHVQPPNTHVSGHSNSHSLASPDEIAFFERAKKFIEDKNTYLEFLKLLNLFVQDIIDSRVLVERAALFIGEAGDIWTQFRSLVGDDQAGRGGLAGVSGRDGLNGSGGILGAGAGLDGVMENSLAVDRPRVDLNSCKAYGASYRRLPKTEVNLSCSGRDPMCWDVLNDEWVSHPTSASEDAAPFISHKKNIYEEALHRAEEERHEYDYHIEANLRTIALLEPIAARINVMSPDEKSVFRLKPGLGGQSKSIYQRIIKKIYGRDAGLEVIGALHDNPTVAVPVVLARLKQKDEEWKRAQREWNKVWREVDAKNFYKSLDHQGVTFKANDKKAITTKSLVAEIEALRKEQVQRRDALIDPSLSLKPKYQYAFKIDDMDCLQDSLKLIFSYLDRAPGGLSSTDRERVESFLRAFIPTFFLFPRAEFDSAFVIPGESGSSGEGPDGEDSELDGSDGGSATDDRDDGTSVGSNRRSKKASDLRRKVLKGAVGASNGANNSAGPSGQSGVTPGATASKAGSKSATSTPTSAASPAGTDNLEDPDAMDVQITSLAEGVTTALEAAVANGTAIGPSESGVPHTAGDSPSAAPAPEGDQSMDVDTALTPMVDATAASAVTMTNVSEDVSSVVPASVVAAATNEQSAPTTAETIPGEKTWISVDEPGTSEYGDSRASSPAGSMDASGLPRQPSRKANFFTNTPFYCMFRLFQMLYNRLSTLKAVAKVQSTQEPPSSLVNPLAIELGLNDAGGPAPALMEGSNPPAQFYEHLLDLCEKLFDNEIDQAGFEENMRHMYGTKAYVSFTLDKLIAAIVKQVQTVLGDGRSQELLSLLYNDRNLEVTTARQQISYRMSAENVLGQDENLFRVEWVDGSKSLLIQLLGKDDLTLDDAITAEQKWKAYLASFILTHPTEGLPARVKQPFLKRNMQTLASPPSPSTGYIAESGLEIKVCIGSYKLFFVPDTEDFFSRQLTVDEGQTRRALSEGNRKLAKVKLDRFLESKIGPVEGAIAHPGANGATAPSEPSSISTEPAASTVLLAADSTETVGSGNVLTV